MSMYNYLIVGGGPSGLTAARVISQTKSLSHVVLDSGLPLEERDPDEQSDLGTGIGGAGLFSDGKFSYYPSGTGLYNLKNKQVLEDSYNSVMQLLEKQNIGTKPYNVNGYQQENGLKAYDSVYATLEQRKAFISDISQGLNIRTQTTVKDIVRKSYYYEITAINSLFQEEVYRSQKIIIATGRTGPLFLSKFNIETKPIRYEFGIRIETNLDHKIFLHPENENYNQLKDVKLIQDEEDGIQIRTFCTCRGGEIANIKFDDFSAISGRSEPNAKDTGFANFGLLMKFKDESYSEGKELFDEIMNHPNIKAGKAMYQTLRSFMGLSESSAGAHQNRPWIGDIIPAKLDEELSQKLAGVIKKAVNQMLIWDPVLNNDTSVIIFPTIEGFGEYPELERESLKVPNQPIWIAGDLSGTFRGLVPALVSGEYAAREALLYNEVYEAKVEEKDISFDIDGRQGDKFLEEKNQSVFGEYDLVFPEALSLESPNKRVFD